MRTLFVLEPPSNASFSPPLISEAQRLPAAVGHFTLSTAAPIAPAAPSESGLRTLVLLPLPGPAAADWTHTMAGGLRALLGWDLHAPLHVHLVGTAESVKLALRSASSTSLRAMMRAHLFSAMALRLSATANSELAASAAKV